MRLRLFKPVQLQWALALAFSVTIVATGQEDVAPVHRNAEQSEANTPISEEPLTAADREHWAFRPVARLSPPKMDGATWARGAIDAFILDRQRKENLAPAGHANRETLLRRVTFDLIGLPPTFDELQEFDSEASPDSYERLVDRLLASPAYGEHWGQHWLDLARFAETDGFEHDKTRPDAWKYRDWLIDVLNENIPYSEFVRRQLAGDELSEHAQSVATMFCLSGPDMPDINDQFERRHLMLNEMTATVGSVFLGLQLGCAECHDHKYDPVSQSDFYRLRAVFESAVPLLKRDVSNLTLQQSADPPPARFWIRGNHRRPGPIVFPGFPRIASDLALGDRPAPLSPVRQALADWLVRPENPLTGRVIVNRIWKQHFGRGLFDTPSDVGLLNSEPSHPDLLDWLTTDFQNRGWDLKRLHRQLVSSATYRQTSRAILDDPEWNHRLAIDPANALLSRGFRRRLEGEVIRDALLAVSGLLSDERGGPGVMPPLPDELVGTLLKGQWNVSPRAADHDRRSIYLFARRNLRYPLFEVFDRPDANSSCAARNRSTTPTQSLLLLNSAVSLRAAQHLAGRVQRDLADSAVQIDQMFRLAFLRPPAESEIRELVKFIQGESVALKNSGRSPDQFILPLPVDTTRDPFEGAALVQVCLAILNASEFLYID